MIFVLGDFYVFLARYEISQRLGRNWAMISWSILTNPLVMACAKLGIESF